ncbi:MAG: hypothetical protein Q9181_004060 [Wetmoreana brouardii]
MSYNSGYNYSPYYQPTTGQDERGHDLYNQTPTNVNRRYPSQVYSSSNNLGSQQQQSSPFAPTTSSSTDRSSTSYSRYGEASSPADHYQDTRGGYGYVPRSSVDTTALGNLAHASTLGQGSRRDNSSLQQIIDYNRSRSSHGYSGASAYETEATSYNYSHERSDNRGAGSATGSYPRGSEITQNQTTAQHPHTSYAITAEYNNTIPALTATQVVAQNTDYRESYQQNNEEQRQRQHLAQPTRPESGQSQRIHDSRASQQASQSPTTAAYRAPASQPTSFISSNSAQASHRPEPARYTSLQKHQVAQQRASASPAPTLAPEKRDYYSTSAVSGPSAQPPTSSTSTGKSQHTSASGSDSRTLVSPGNQISETVDPSHVFNHAEYQRRQAAAAAEAATATKKAANAKKAAEADEMRKATEAAAALKRVSESSQYRSSNGATLSPESLSKEEQMAAEMRQMIEKMRDYKSKDPSLFSQIWEQVKKTLPAGSVPPVPPLSAKELTGSITIQPSQPNGTRPADAGQSLSPSLAPDQASELPDLRKFPAQRRRRGPNVTPTKKRKNDSLSHINGPQSSSLVDSASQQTQQVSPNTSVSSAEQTCQVVYVSGTGPQAPPQKEQNTPAPTSRHTAGPPSAQVQPPSRGSTNWPEHKKWDLAVAAKKTLLSYPMNAGKAKDITSEQILGLLNQNPSFEQLCQMIESKGFILERSHFARSLLDAIPDMEAGVRQRQQQQQQRSALATRQPAATSNHIQQPNGSGFGIMTTNPNGMRWKTDQQVQQSPQPNGAPIAQMTSKQASQPVNTTPTAEAKPNVPLTKQEMARKRNIAEIVDLSQLSDDDDLPPPPSPPSKVPKVDELSTPLAANQQASQRYGYPPVPPSVASHTFQQPGMPQFMYGPPQPYAQTLYSLSTPPSYKPVAAPQLPAPPALSLSAQQRELINSEDIVRPIDKQKDKKRTNYNPKTIVRDVLIAAGRHPTMQPLNYHLEHLRKTFKHVNDLSDLSTFRWDLVDPGEPVNPAPPAPEIRHINDVDRDADDEGAEDPAPRSRPEMTLNIDTRGSASVAALVQPSHYPSHPPKLLGPQRKRARGQSPVKNNLISKTVNEPSAKTPQAVLSGTATPSTGGSSIGAGSGSSIRRRGRPPGAKNKHPRKSSGIPTQPTNMPSRPRIDTTPANPSGLRNTFTPIDGVAVVVPSPSPSRRGQLKRKSPRTSQQTSPIYRVYKCKWRNCPAELHNLETLKKHVLKHSDEYAADGGPFPCLWRGCGKDGVEEEDEEEQDPNYKPLTFGMHDIWVKHMDRRHIVDDAWRLGDGPNNRSESDMSDYVSDSAKRQVTPIIHKDGQARPDPIPIPLITSGRSAKVYHKTHGITSELGKAEAFMEAAEERRKSLGPGIDRIGATFVTDRKRALLNDQVTPLKKAQKGDDE